MLINFCGENEVSSQNRRYRKKYVTTCICLYGTTQIELIENCLNHSRILLIFNIRYMLVLIDCYRLCTLTSRLFLVLRPEQYPSVQDFQTSMTYKSPSLDRTTWPRDICLQNKVETNEIKLSRGILMSSMKYSLSLNTSYKS